MDKETEKMLMGALQAHEYKIQQLSQQVFSAAMLLEFMIEHLVEAKNEKGEQLIPMDLDKFEEYATARQQEILEEVERVKKEQLAKIADQQVKLDE